MPGSPESPGHTFHIPHPGHEFAMSAEERAAARPDPKSPSIFTRLNPFSDSNSKPSRGTRGEEEPLLSSNDGMETLEVDERPARFTKLQIFIFLLFQAGFFALGAATMKLVSSGDGEKSREPMVPPVWTLPPVSRSSC
jgi:hypothetical protein